MNASSKHHSPVCFSCSKYIFISGVEPLTGSTVVRIRRYFVMNGSSSKGLTNYYPEIRTVSNIYRLLMCFLVDYSQKSDRVCTVVSMSISVPELNNSYTVLIRLTYTI